MSLLIDGCTYKAAKYAVEHWHYSGAMLAGKLVKFGVWEDEKFIGCVIYGRGANNNIGKPYGLKQTECCELVRIAPREHKAPVSKVGSITIRLLRRANQKLRMIVSYADPQQRHCGSIYQAMNWLYIGMSDNWRGSHYIVNGQRMHGRSVRSKWGHEKNIPYEWEIAPPANKHKYIYPLDKAMRRKVEHLSQPYPKHADA